MTHCVRAFLEHGGPRSTEHILGVCGWYKRRDESLIKKLNFFLYGKFGNFVWEGTTVIPPEEVSTKHEWVGGTTKNEGRVTSDSGQSSIFRSYMFGKSGRGTAVRPDPAGLSNPFGDAVSNGYWG